MAPSALTATELEKVNALLKKTFGTCSRPADLAATLVRLVNSCQAMHTTAVAAKKKRTRVEMETESAVVPVSRASAIPHASVSHAQSVAPSPDKLRTREWCDLLRGIMACSDSPSSLTLALVAIQDLIQAQCNIIAPVPPLSPRYRDRTPDGSSSPLIHPYYFGVLSSPSKRGASASPRVASSPCHVAHRADELSSPTPPPRSVHSGRVSTAITRSPSTSSSSQHVSSSPMSDSPLASPVPALSAEDAAYAAWHDLVARALGVYARVCALSTPSRLRIRNVCHKLRVDLGSPELWTDVSRPRSNKHDVFDAVLQLSGSHDFTVNIDSAGCGDAELNFAALALHAGRLRGLSVTSSMYKHVPEMRALLVAYTGRLETCRLAFPSTPAILRPGRFPGPAVTTLACLVDQLVQEPFPGVTTFEALAPDYFHDERDDDARHSHGGMRILETFGNLERLILRAWLEDVEETRVRRGTTLQSLVIEETPWKLFLDRKVTHTFTILRSRDIQQIRVYDAPASAVSHLRAEVQDQLDTFQYRPAADNRPDGAVLYLETLKHARAGRQRWLHGVSRDALGHELRRIHKFRNIAVLGLPNDLCDSDIVNLFKAQLQQLRELELFFVEHPIPDEYTVLTFPNRLAVWRLPTTFRTLSLTGVGKASVDAAQVFRFILDHHLLLPGRGYLRLNVHMRNLKFDRDTAAYVDKLDEKTSLVFF